MSSYQVLKFRITGVAPLLMHNGQLADPLNPHSQSIAEVTGKLYLMNGEPCIPSEMIGSAIVKGATKEKRGPAARAGILVETHAKLEYSGPRKPDELWQDERSHLRAAVKVGTSRVIRTRPRFDDWAADIEVKFLPSLCNAKDVRGFRVTAGEQIELGD